MNHIIILIIILIGILLMMKSYLKNKYIEAFSWSDNNGPPAISNDGTYQQEEDYNKFDIPPLITQPSFDIKKDSDGREIVGSIPPPNFDDSIYDHNLRDALNTWKKMGCSVTSQYAPSVNNKDTLFASNVGWASDDYPFRVKSLEIEANKPEYNYYDWGKYKDKDSEKINDGEKNNNVNLWNLDKDIIDSEREKEIKRPTNVKYPMGVRKARALCYGKDPGGYKMPKKGDKVKIKDPKSKKYDGDYFAGIVMTKDVKEITPSIEVFWEQRGVSEYKSSDNKIINEDAKNECKMDDLKAGEGIGCTRNETKDNPAELQIPEDSRKDNNDLKWQLYGNNSNGQQDWFGWPNITPDDVPSGAPWKNRYIYGRKNHVPKKLKEFSSDLIDDEGKIDPKDLFVVETCQENSACEDLRCNTRTDKMRKKYPLTKVCKKTNLNTYSETKGMLCTGGVHKGFVYTYYDMNSLCTDQDMQGDENSTPARIACLNNETYGTKGTEGANASWDSEKSYCTKTYKNYKETYTKNKIYAEVYSKAGYKGKKAIILQEDGVVDIATIFPGGGSIKSVKLNENAGLVNTITKKIIGGEYGQSYNATSISDFKNVRVVRRISPDLKSDRYSGNNFLLAKESSHSDGRLETVTLPNPTKIKYIQVKDLKGGDDNEGDTTTKFLIKAGYKGKAAEEKLLNPSAGSDEPYSYEYGGAGNKHGRTGDKDYKHKYGEGIERYMDDKDGLKPYNLWEGTGDCDLSDKSLISAKCELVNQKLLEGIGVAALYTGLVASASAMYVAAAMNWWNPIGMALMIAVAMAFLVSAANVQKNFNNKWMKMEADFIIEQRGITKEMITKGVKPVGGNNVLELDDSNELERISIFANIIDSNHKLLYNGFDKIILYSSE